MSNGSQPSPRIRSKRWKELGIQDGFGEIRFLKWRYFVNYINQEMLDYETYIWRGQRCDNWTLKSTLDRLIKKANIAKTKHPGFRTSHLEQFKYAARGRRGLNPPAIEDENEWWALGQHHGLSTPLLDWTTSPFVAAYFALIGTGADRTAFRAIYALYRPSVESKVKELIQQKESQNEEKRAEMEKRYEKSGKPEGLPAMALARAIHNLSRPVRPEVEFIRPKSDENQRLVSQGGLFTRAPIGTTLDDWVKKNFAGKKGSYTLMKLLIPDEDREEGLRMLNRMNINHLTLFPDLDGASKYCNLFGEIEKY
jgi:hypothetical protein